jgi:hypothetical protein
MISPSDHAPASSGSMPIDCIEAEQQTGSRPTNEVLDGAFLKA